MATNRSDTQVARSRQHAEIGQLIRTHAETITELWCQRIRREQDGTEPIHRQEMRDHVPEFLRTLGMALAEIDGQVPLFGVVAGEHGEQRWRVGWELSEVVRDYQILRIGLTEYLPEQLNRPLEPAEILAIGVWLDDAITAAIVMYVRHEQLSLNEAQERLRTLNNTLDQQVAQRTTELVQRVEQNRLLVTELTQVQQTERQRIARTLHDDLQQLLVAAKMNVAQLASEGHVDPSLASYDAASSLLNDAIRVTRCLTAELNPLTLLQDGLAAGLKWLANHFNHTYHLGVELVGDFIVPADKEGLSLLLFDGVRELLFNVVKHAQTNRAQVSISNDGKALRVTVRDYGAGFDPLQKGVSFGLTELRRRLELMAGTLLVEASPGAGCSVSIFVPL